MAGSIPLVSVAELEQKKAITFQFTDADGKATTVSRNSGEAMWTPAGKHLPENIGSEPLEVLLIELKSK